MFQIYLMDSYFSVVIVCFARTPPFFMPESVHRLFFFLQMLQTSTYPVSDSFHTFFTLLCFWLWSMPACPLSQSSKHHPFPSILWERREASSWVIERLINVPLKINFPHSSFKLGSRNSTSSVILIFIPSTSNPDTSVIVHMYQARLHLMLVSHLSYQFKASPPSTATSSANTRHRLC